MAFNPEVEDFAKQSFSAAEVIGRGIAGRVQEMEPLDGSHAILALAAGAAGILRVLADMICVGRPGQDMTNKAGREAQLVAALLTARVFTPIEKGCSVDYTPRNILAAIEAAGKLADKDLKPFINQHLIAAYSKFVEKEKLTLGYWDYLPEVGPDFSDLGDNLVNFVEYTKTRH